MTTLRVVTINTGKCDGPYRERIEWLATELTALDPDIVALQEAFCAADGRADTAALLASRLGLHLAWLPARYKARLLEGSAVEGWSGLALLSRSPWRWHDPLPLPDDDRDGPRAALLAGTVLGPWKVTAASLPPYALGGR